MKKKSLPSIINKSANESLEFVESIINSVREPLITLDQDLRVVTASRSFYESFKVKAEETVGQLIYNLGNHQWDIPRLRELLENVLAKKISFDNYEVEHDFTTIGKRFMILNARLIQRVFGKERIILLAIEDITERKQADEELKKYREHIEELVKVRTAALELDVTERKRAEKALTLTNHTIKSILECISITDSDNTILFVNQAFLDTYGYAEEELIGKSIYIVRTDVPSGKDAILQETLSGGWHGELLNRKKDGTVFPISLSTSVVYNEKKQPIGLVGIAVDITERKQAEEILLLQNVAVQSAANAIAITDREGKIISVNRAFCQLTGYSQEEVNGKKFNILNSGKQPQSFYKNLWETIIAGFIWTGEIVNKRKDGSLYTAEMTITPVYQSHGEISHFIAINQDVTEQKKLQSQFLQAQKNQSIGTLAGGIAHDFNNILGIILAYSSMSKRIAGDKEKILENSRIIAQAVNRGAALVRQILTFARKTDMVLAPTSLNDLILELISMLEQTFPKVITFKKNIDKDVLVINADRTQIHQAILNLCVNARDAMPKGGSITLKTERQTKTQVQKKFPSADQDEYVCIYVTDTGEGMDEATRYRVFDPFFTTKEQGKGTGLGLAVVYGVVQSHHGFIDVESEVGRGTTFMLYFPIPLTSEQMIDVPLAIESFSTGGTETILLVEDEVALIEMVHLFLESKGYTVYTAQDGYDAIKVYKQHKQEISLVLTDVGLPGMTGMDEFKKLREITPNVNVIFASGFFDPDIKSELYLAGAKGFIQKPYSPDEVLQRIREVLDAK